MNILVCLCLYLHTFIHGDALRLNWIRKITVPTSSSTSQTSIQYYTNPSLHLLCLLLIDSVSLKMKIQGSTNTVYKFFNPHLILSGINNNNLQDHALLFIFLNSTGQSIHLDNSHWYVVDINLLIHIHIYIHVYIYIHTSPFLGLH